MRKTFLFCSTALKFIAWAVIPFLIFACRTAKTVQNKSTFATDTIIVHTTDTIQQVRWHLRTDTLRERIYERDSTSQRQAGDTIIREIWHWRERTADRSRTATDSLQLRIASHRDTLRATERQETQREETTKHSEPPWYERILFWMIILIVFVAIYKKSIRS